MNALIAAFGSLLISFAAHAQTPERKSGFETMSPALQMMQKDDLSNPAMLAAGQGERIWTAVPSGRQSCRDCHGEADISMKGVSVRYPAFDTRSGHPITLAGRIAQCRVEWQGQPAQAPEAATPIALEAFIALQSRGMPMVPSTDPRLEPAFVRGKMLFSQRMGQLDLSCAQCHDDNAGKRLGASIIPEGHSTGYPLFRLEWQATGTLSRRIRNCLTGIRAEPLDAQSDDMIALALFLARRAAGMISDAPGVRP